MKLTATASRRTMRNLTATFFAALMVGAAVHAGPVADLIDQAHRSGSQRSATEVSVLGLELGLRTLAPPEASPSVREAIVTEALDILDAGATDEATLSGLMRGLATVRESTNPRIAASLCFRSGSSFSTRIRAEAHESLRIRCLAGEGDLSACACL